MRKYETIYIVQPDLGDDEIKALSEKVMEVISGMKGNCLRLEDWGTRKLAYPIKKQTRGRYFYLNSEGDSSLIAELERRLRLDDKVIRYQSVKLEKEIHAPAPAAEKPVVEESSADTVEEVAATESAE
ncbi:MAG: 30S ribosomal protein S6 [Geobacteraceae bacterium]|nr:30S ribosomal protein S6 [Geobacteraceae bacterium]